MAEDLGFRRMLAIQDELQAKYAGVWEPVGPGSANDKLLWAVGELGEVAQILKKRGAHMVLEDPETRRHFVEEMADVYMYLADVLNCCSITAEEVATAYEAKHAYNMRRDYGSQAAAMFETSPESEG